MTYYEQHPPRFWMTYPEYVTWLMTTGGSASS